MSRGFVSAWMLLGLVHAGVAQYGPSPVEVAPLEMRQIGKSETFVGTVEPARISVVGSKVENRLVEILVDEGDRVEKGAVIARLETTTLQIRMKSAEATLKLREAELSELKNGTRREEIEKARADAGRAKAEIEYWDWQIERVKSLASTNVVSDEELRNTQRQLEISRQDALGMEAALEQAVNGPRKERIQAAEANVEIARAALEQLKVDIEDHAIRAPFTGYVIRKASEVGEWVGVGDALVELAELDVVEIIAAVPEDAVTHLNRGDTARVELSAIPTDVFTGEVAAIVPQGDVNSRTFPVKVRLENTLQGDQVLIKAGMFTRLTLSVGEKREALVAPKDALVLGGPTPMVYVVSPKPEASDAFVALAVPVTLGAAEGDYIEVSGDLKAGDKVVVLGNERLQPGRDIVPMPWGATRPSSDGNGGTAAKSEAEATGARPVESAS